MPFEGRGADSGYVNSRNQPYAGQVRCGPRDIADEPGGGFRIPAFRGIDQTTRSDREERWSEGWRYVTWQGLSVEIARNGWPGLAKAATGRHHRIIKSRVIREALGGPASHTANHLLRLYDAMGLLDHSPGEYVPEPKDEADWERATTSVDLRTTEEDAFECAWSQATDSQSFVLYAASVDVSGLVDLEGVCQPLHDCSATPRFARRVGQRPGASWMASRGWARERLSLVGQPTAPMGLSSSSAPAWHTEPVPRFVMVLGQPKVTDLQRAKRALDQSCSDGTWTVAHLMSATTWPKRSAHRWVDKALRGMAIEVVVQGKGNQPTWYRFTSAEPEVPWLPE